MGGVCCNKRPEGDTVDPNLIVQHETSECTDFSSKVDRKPDPSLAVQPLYYFHTHETKDKGKVAGKERRKPREARRSLKDKAYVIKTNIEMVPETVEVVGEVVDLKKGRRDHVVNLSECRMLENKREETKIPDSVKSTGRTLKPQSTQFNLNPSNFRRENKGRIEDYYDFFENIGKGACGVVRAANDKITRERRAVKVIVKSQCQATERLSEEIRILQKLVITTTIIATL